MSSPIPAAFGRPGVSFVVNSYNQAGTIRACLNGVLTQQLGATRSELIVVDDGSDDGTHEIIDEVLSLHDSRQMRHVRFERAGGTLCRQRAVDIAEYELVLLLGGDFILSDPTVTGKMLAELDDDEPFVSLYGPHGGMGTIYRRSALNTVGGFDLRFNRFGSGYRDDSDLHYRLLDQGWTGRHLPHLRSSFRHEQAHVRSLRGALAYAMHRVAVHQVDPLLFRCHPGRFRKDFRPIGRLANPVDDFRRATGQWRKGGRFELSSPQGVTLVSGKTVLGRLVTVLGGVAYVIAVHVARIRGSITYRKVLL